MDGGEEGHRSRRSVGSGAVQGDGCLGGATGSDPAPGGQWDEPQELPQNEDHGLAGLSSSRDVPAPGTLGQIFQRPQEV